MYPAVIILLSAFMLENINYVVYGMLELLIIFLATTLLSHIQKLIGKIFNCIALLIINIQYTVLYFSNSFVSLVMLNNMESVEAISGKLVIYLVCIVLLLISAFSPVVIVKSFHENSMKKMCVYLLVIVCLYVGIGWITGGVYSTFNAVANLGDEYIEQKKLQTKVAEAESDYGIGFFSEAVTDYVKKPSSLPDKPNIILIFTEGLSQNIISDERDIMPNVRKVQEEALSFDNYFNHTFATYMGLQGQLYSGYQMQNYDKNMLISLQDILSKQGYETSFINTEPYNEEFTIYLSNMGFDNLVNNLDLATAQANTISDKDAYSYLFEYCLEKKKEDKPFFTAIYTFGTHTQWICEDEIYGNGSSNYLNKFYNADFQFGRFMKNYISSELLEDTIIVFTTDHATYMDSDFVDAFPEYQRTAENVDEIPLFIYYKDVETDVIDVNGRNSLDLTPTILDYLDYSGENYFLGMSLFASKDIENKYDTIFQSLSDIYTTKDAEIEPLENERREFFQENLEQYFIAKLQGTSEPYIETETINGNYIKVVLHNAEMYEKIWFPIWSVENGQDDIVWYQGEKSADGTWQCIMNRMEKGTHNVHVYAGKESPETVILHYVIV